MDITNKIYKEVFNCEFDQKDINKYVKAVIINFGDERGDIVVYNDNFGTNEKMADFTNGKKAAGLNPLQIVMTDIEFEHKCGTRYIGSDDKIHTF